VGQDPSEIRQDIERTRAEMGDTVEALSYKADVKARAKDSITDRVDSVKSRVGIATSKVSDATPSGQDVKHGARRAKGIAEENPLGLAIGAVAVGFVAGLVVPSTRAEDERIGPMADQVKDMAKETGQEALERGKQVAEQTAQSAKETAQQAGQEHAQELKESAAQGARDAAPTPSS
jgi:gas vesicle protein